MATTNPKMNFLTKQDVVKFLMSEREQIDIALNALNSGVEWNKTTGLVGNTGLKIAPIRSVSRSRSRARSRSVRPTGTNTANVA